MRSPVTGIVALFVLFVALIVAYSSVFTVQQTEQSPSRAFTSRRLSSTA